PHRPPAAPALGGRAATGGDRARDRDRPRPARRRRADRRPRRPQRHRHPRSAARAQPELPEDRRHGDPRSACGALRRPARAARQGRVDRCRGYAMTWALFVWCNLRRHPLRTTLTTLSIALSIFLVCAVLTLPGTLNMILERATSDTRISVHHKAGL